MFVRERERARNAIVETECEIYSVSAERKVMVMVKKELDSRKGEDVLKTRNKIVPAVFQQRKRRGG